MSAKIDHERDQAAAKQYVEASLFCFHEMVRMLPGTGVRWMREMWVDLSDRDAVTTPKTEGGQ